MSSSRRSRSNFLEPFPDEPEVFQPFDQHRPLPTIKDSLKLNKVTIFHFKDLWPRILIRHFPHFLRSLKYLIVISFTYFFPNNKIFRKFCKLLMKKNLRNQKRKTIQRECQDYFTYNCTLVSSTQQPLSSLPKTTNLRIKLKN